jgi:hypothetical protein
MIYSRRTLENAHHIHQARPRERRGRLQHLQPQNLPQDVRRTVSPPPPTLHPSHLTISRNHSFTWLNSRLEPVEIPAYEYLSLVQRYVGSKIDDYKIFPTDPSGVSFADPPFSSQDAPTTPSSEDWTGKRSGFPPNFFDVCQKIFRQMVRVYAHLYWSHFEDPMYNMGLEKSMNSCFSHFVLTATTLELLEGKDLEPMQALIDLWAANGTFPKESRAFSFANEKVGERLVELAGVGNGTQA